MMLEKIARAICEKTYGWREMSMPTPWLDDAKRAVAMDSARAAVQAMREPTKEMIQQGNSEIDDHIESYNYESDWGYDLGVDAARKGWETMIDVILNEKPVELASPRRAKRRR